MPATARAYLPTHEGLREEIPAGNVISDAAYLNYVRERCEDPKTGFKFFVKYFYKEVRNKGQRFVFKQFHHDICDLLMMVWRGELKNLRIHIPPRYGKTELVVILFAAWCFMKNPRCQFMHLSFSDPLVKRNSDYIRDIIKSPQWVQLWPHITVQPAKDGKKEWELVQGGVFYAQASGGAVTGMGAGLTTEYDPETGKYEFSGCLLLDDMIKPDDARHQIIREGVNVRWPDTIKSRRNSPQTTPTIYIGQRVHQEDFASVLANDNECAFYEYTRPALNDNEEALWPEKHTPDMLRAMRDAPTAEERFTFSCQYQQTPKPKGGNIIKTACFKTFVVPPRILWRAIYADTAMKTKERNDYSVLQCWGATEDRKAALLAQRRGKWEAPKLLLEARAFWNEQKAVQGMGTLRRINVEDKASGTGLIQSLQTGEFDANGQMIQPPIPVRGIERNVDKYTRVTDATPYIESGLVLLWADAPWLSGFLAECEEFTANDSHLHDDQIDPMCDAITEILAAKRGYFS